MTGTGTSLIARPGTGARAGVIRPRAATSIRSCFFPVGNAGPALLQISQAKQVCAACPARTPCLQWALDSGQEAGVWGGTSEDERRAVRYRRMRPAGTGPEVHRGLGENGARSAFPVVGHGAEHPSAGTPAQAAQGRPHVRSMR